ncbi:MAG: hypothetical protein INR71_10615, partial [Terriglobus roseus]|nr:hypothetical protein [Terriglobus roseus]
LAYGPLYNTYSDEAAPFAFIPVLLTFIRGAAIGAVQPSGIAQIVLLAICEVIFLLTLHAFRPFNAPTSMNAYHTFFSIIRLITTLLMIAFAPTLDVSESTKGWLGYAILLLHAIVLVFGFFLNAIQTLIEVAARSSSVGAGNRDARGGLSKVFGMRQLSKRARRREVRTSLTSDAAILTQDGDAKSLQFRDGGRSRSLSASSAILLQNGTSGGGRDRTSTGLISDFGGETSPGYTTPGATSPNLHVQKDGTGVVSGPTTRRGTLGSKRLDQGDAFYRQPRPRRPTMEAALSDDPRSPDSADFVAAPYRDSPDRQVGDRGEGPSDLGSPVHRNSITPAFLRDSHYSDNNSDPYLSGGQRVPIDYTVRESDFLYGVRRGQALSNTHSRRLKTGPADPVGPVSSATGWFKSMFGGGKKEKPKGFEVVRSRPYPLAALDEDGDEGATEMQHPYRDSPDSEIARGGFHGQQATAGAEAGSGFDGPQLLGPIDMGDDIRIPSRIGSRTSVPSVYDGQATAGAPSAPGIPRRSSKRTPSMDIGGIFGDGTKAPSPVYGGRRSRHGSRSGSGNNINAPQQVIAEEERPRSAHYLLANSTAQSRSTTRLPFGGADFAPDSSEPSPDPTPEERSPYRNVRESVASSVYPASEGGTPLAGGGVGFDDRSMYRAS